MISKRIKIKILSIEAISNKGIQYIIEANRIVRYCSPEHKYCCGYSSWLPINDGQNFEKNVDNTPLCTNVKQGYKEAYKYFLNKKVI